MDSVWWRRIYAVCERSGPGFWDEPANALSSTAFLLAAYLAWRRWRSAGGDDRAVAALIAVGATIGLGSFLFHTFATRWALSADVLPIQVFIGGYLVLALRRFLRVPWLLVPVAFLACWLVVDQWRAAVPWEWGWRWRSYGSALALLVVVGALAPLRAPWWVGANLLAAAALFTVSLIAATGDRASCAVMPFGLHPVWHVLNALTLYWLLHVAMAARRGHGIAGAGERGEALPASPARAPAARGPSLARRSAPDEAPVSRPSPLA